MEKLKKYESVYKENDRVLKIQNAIEKFAKTHPQRVVDVIHTKSHGANLTQVLWKRGMSITSVTLQDLVSIYAFDAIEVKKDSLIISFIY